MNPAVIIRSDPRDDTLIYCERFENTVREATIGYHDKSWGISFFGFEIGFKKMIVYENTLEGWHWPNKEMHFSEEERSRVLKAIELLLSNQGHRVQIKTWAPKVRILNIGPED
jgi:hypothetical protein